MIRINVWVASYTNGSTDSGSVFRHFLTEAEARSFVEGKKHGHVECWAVPDSPEELVKFLNDGED